MLIGEFSRISGVSIDTLRYYDQIGLLVPERVRKKRAYTDDDIKKLEIINALKDMRFSLEDIKMILELDEKVDESLKSNNKCINEIKQCLSIVDDKYKVILRQEQALQKTKSRLIHIKDKMSKFLQDEGVE